jgi:hypothetical protein
MRRIQLTLLALASFLLISGAAYAAEPAAPAEAQQAAVTAPAATAEAATQAVETEAALCQLLEVTRTNVLESATAGYWCPPYSRYCRTNAQCSGYCGAGYDHWAVCEFGCCACLG